MKIIQNIELFLKSKINSKKLNENVSQEISEKKESQLYQYSVGICGEFRK